MLVYVCSCILINFDLQPVTTLSSFGTETNVWGFVALHMSGCLKMNFEDGISYYQLYTLHVIFTCLASRLAGLLAVLYVVYILYIL